MSVEVCPNCFGTEYQNGVCAICGYQLLNDKNRSARNLPAGVILNRRYYVGRLLGAGGFGITYKAFDLAQGEICCVKEYAPSDLCSRVGDGHSLELLSREYEEPYRAGLRRFTDEAQILGGLGRIPSVVNITDTFWENNTAYFIMEYLDGADLKKIVRTSAGVHPLTVDQATDIILQVALSMDVIHTKTGIIHRDISPENIYITRDGKVKLIDFGSAKRTENGLKSGLSVVLKPKYAPPEQFSSEMVQGAFTDVYSLASTYYYVLTGENVPSAPDRLTGKGYPSLRQLGIGVSDTVSDAVDHALVLNVHNRTPSMQAFIAEIASGMPQREETQGTDSQQFPTEAERPYVAVAEGQEKGRKWYLSANQFVTLGRSSEAVLQIKYPDISRIHCQIAYMTDTKTFYIQDKSMNGIFYKGVRLQKEMIYQVKAPAVFVLANPACAIELGVDYEHH